MLLSSFVGALSLFGEESMGRIEEITIKGLDIQMIIVNKYNLTLIVILDKYFVKHNMRQEAEKSLDMFYSLYCDEIGECVDINTFAPFKEVLIHQINRYFEKSEDSDRRSEIKDFGFFTEAIAKLRNNS
jgi:hypothetical protein